MSRYRVSSQLELKDQPIYKALIASMVLHSLLTLIYISEPEVKDRLRDDAIKISMATKLIEAIPRPAIKPVIAEPPKKVIQKPQPKIDAGTNKRVMESKTLGDKTAPKVVENVQKGDPASKLATAYKPGTEFRKMPTASIGTGGNSNTPSALSAGGSGDTYKAPNFAVKNPSAMLSGSRYTIKTVDDGGAGTGSGGGIGAGKGKGYGDGTITGRTDGTVEQAKILTNMGSLTGSTVGTIATSKGAEGLSSKGSVAVAKMPEDTVILGNMDPDAIRRVLLQHLAQFRYCYQSELDEVKSNKFSGLMNLNFNIDGSGDVSRVDVKSATGINNEVTGCVAEVLRGIQFPAPRGGGLVQVKQPINFYPKSN